MIGSLARGSASGNLRGNGVAMLKKGGEADSKKSMCPDSVTVSSLPSPRLAKWGSGPAGAQDLLCSG
nr:hypothetical protein [Tanacetum cinerariifolium]